MQPEILGFASVKLRSGSANYCISSDKFGTRLAYAAVPYKPKARQLLLFRPSLPRSPVRAC